MRLLLSRRLNRPVGRSKLQCSSFAGFIRTHRVETGMGATCPKCRPFRQMPTVAVGTIITDRPPHRSVRARLRIRLLPWIDNSKAACRTPPLPWDMRFPALCREHVGLNSVVHGLCPFLPSLRERFPFFVRLVHRYYGTVRLLQHVHVRRSVYGLRGPALILRPRRAGDLPVLVHVVSRRAWVLRLRRTDNPLATNVVDVLPSSSRNEVGILIHRLFAAQSPRPPMPLSTLQTTPRDVARKTRGQDGFATSFPGRSRDHDCS